MPPPRLLVGAAVVFALAGCEIVAGLGDIELSTRDASGHPTDEGDADLDATLDDATRDGAEMDAPSTTDGADVHAASDASDAPLRPDGPPPPGFAPCLFQPSTRYDCPGAGETPIDVQVAPAPTTACNCKCTSTVPTNPTCGGTGDEIFVKNDDPNFCAGATNTTVQAASGACGATNITLSSANLAMIFGVMGGATCGGTTSDLTQVTNGRICTMPGPEMPPPAYLACITRVGHWPCPPAFPNTYSVGSSVQDSRDCLCSCDGKVGCSGTLTLFSNAGCTGTSTVLTETCSSTVSGTFKSYRLDTTMTGAPSCQIFGETTPIGSATTMDERTVCCP
jgi:hypothetical protein